MSAFSRWLGNPCSGSQLGRINFSGSRRPEILDSNRATPGVGSIFGEFCMSGLIGGTEVHVDVGIISSVLDFVDVVSTQRQIRLEHQVKQLNLHIESLEQFSDFPVKAIVAR